jgi:hypothetical protein
MLVFSRRLTYALTLFLLAGTRAIAAEYFIDVNHSAAADANPGTEVAPWKTIYAIDSRYTPTAPTFQPGDIITVKPGTYIVDHGGSFDSPAVEPQQSGAPGAPITIRSQIRHGAIIDGKGGSAPLGSTRHNHIVIDGFHIQNSSGVIFFGYGGESNRITDLTVKNSIIHDCHQDTSGSNAECVRLENLDGALVQDNVLYNVTNRPTIAESNHNASCTKSYRTRNVIIEHNEMYNCVGGIYDKRSGEHNHYRYNYIHDLYGTDPQGYTAGGYNTGEPQPQDINIYQNIFVNTREGGEGGAFQPFESFYNNLVLNYNHNGWRGGGAPSDNINKVYNNIFYRTSGLSGGDACDMCTWDGNPNEYAVIDYNMYPPGVALQFAVNVGGTPTTYSSLTAWRNAWGFDTHSLVADPLFVDIANKDLRLQPGSPAINAGRVGGTSGGAPVNMGPYITGAEVIGVRADAKQPKAPTLLPIQ